MQLVLQTCPANFVKEATFTQQRIGRSHFKMRSDVSRYLANKNARRLQEKSNNNLLWFVAAPRHDEAIKTCAM